MGKQTLLPVLFWAILFPLVLWTFHQVLLAVPVVLWMFCQVLPPTLPFPVVLWTFLWLHWTIPTVQWRILLFLQRNYVWIYYFFGE